MLEQTVLLSWPAAVQMSVPVPEACGISHICLTEKYRTVRVTVCGLNLPQDSSQ